MPTTTLMFEISGDISFNESSNTLSFPYSNEINFLNSHKAEIESSTLRNISDALAKMGINATPRLDIRFEQGSILLTGMVLIEYAGKISGAIAMLEYTKRFISWALNKNITDAASRLAPVVVNINTNFTERIENTAIDMAEAGALAMDTPQVLGFKQSTILIAITLLNVALFLGGTIYTGFQINSIQERYNIANEKIKKAEDEFNEASRVFQHSQIIFQSRLGALDTIADDIRNKKLELQNMLVTNKIDIGKSVNQLNFEVRSYTNSLRDTRDKVDVARKNVDILDSRLTRLTSSNKKIEINDFWYISGTGLKLLCVLFTLLILIAFIRTLRKPKVSIF